MFHTRFSLASLEPFGEAIVQQGEVECDKAVTWDAAFHVRDKRVWRMWVATTTTGSSVPSSFTVRVISHTLFQLRPLSFSLFNIK